MIDREVAELHDVTVRAEVTHYRALTADLAYLEGPPHGVGKAVGRDEFQEVRLHPLSRDG
jgi:hypothetical protein